MILEIVFLVLKVFKIILKIKWKYSILKKSKNIIQWLFLAQSRNIHFHYALLKVYF